MAEPQTDIDSHKKLLRELLLNVFLHSEPKGS